MVGNDDVLEGRYRIAKQLAEGEMGIVFAAQNLADQRRVAIKVLRNELASDASVVDRFLGEAKRAGELGHPNLVASFDVGFTPDREPYVVFEQLKGTPLAQVLGRGGSMLPARAVRIAGQIASAMQAAHDAGIVHRHLTADNILILDDQVKVIGFGSKFVGTPDVLAPEQLKRPENADRRSDIYALGVILHEMLVGERPRKGNATFNRVGLSAGLAELIVARMLAKDPGARPQSMSEVSTALEAHTSRQRVSLRPRVQRPSESVPFPRGQVNMLDTRSHPVMMPTGSPTALYVVLGLTAVLVALIFAWLLKSSGSTEVATRPAPVVTAAAASAPSIQKPVEQQVAVAVDSDAPNSRVTFRRRTATAPMMTDVLANQIVELVEVAAPGYKTERYWLTLDRPTHLKAHLVKGTGLDEASEEMTLVALGEQVAPPPAAEPVAVAPVAKAPVVVAKAPVIAPRRIGRNAEPAPVAAVAEPVVEAPPPVATPTPEPAPVVKVEEHPTVALPAPPPAAAPVAPHNISPAAFKALRTSGNEEIAAPSSVAQQMGRDSKKMVTAIVKACVSASGSIANLNVIKSSGYPEYDKQLLEGVRGWHFKSGDPVCSALAFAYKL